MFQECINASKICKSIKCTGCSYMDSTEQRNIIPQMIKYCFIMTKFEDVNNASGKIKTFSETIKINNDLSPYTGIYYLYYFLYILYNLTF